MITDGVEEIVERLPEQVPEMVRKECEDMITESLLLYSLKPVYLPLEGRKRQMVETICTRCGQITYFEKVNCDCCSARNLAGCSYGFETVTGEPIFDGMTHMCPDCSAPVTVKHISGADRYPMGERRILTVHNIGGKLALLQWKIEKWCDKTGHVEFCCLREEGCVIINGKYYAVTGRVRSFFRYIYYSKWRIYKGKQIKTESFDKLFFCDNPEETESRYSALKEYIELSGYNTCDPAAYLRLWCYMPQLENLVRRGIINPVEEAIYRCIDRTSYYTESRTFHVRGAETVIIRNRTKPHEMLGIEKDELWIAKKYSYSTFDFYKKIKNDMRIRLDEKNLGAVEKNSAYRIKYVMNTMQNFGKRTGIVRLLNYIGRQDIISATVFLRDYWRMYAELYGELRDDSMFPKDLVRAHDNVMNRLAQRKNDEKKKKQAEQDEKIKERYKALAQLSMKDEETALMIRPCATYAELAREGKMLCHCVESYAGAVARGETSIFFIRKIEAPDVPFYTLELRGVSINQDHGYKNAIQTPEVMRFEEKWLKYIRGKVVQDG